MLCHNGLARRDVHGPTEARNQVDDDARHVPAGREDAHRPQPPAGVLEVMMRGRCVWCQQTAKGTAERLRSEAPVDKNVPDEREHGGADGRGEPILRPATDDCERGRLRVSTLQRAFGKTPRRGTPWCGWQGWKAGSVIGGQHEARVQTDVGGPGRMCSCIGRMHSGDKD